MSATEHFYFTFLASMARPRLIKMIEKHPCALTETAGFLSWLSTTDGMNTFLAALDEHRESGNIVACAISTATEFEGIILLVRDELNPSIGELSLWISEHRRRKGLVARASMSLMRHAFSRLAYEKAIIRCDRQNVACMRLANKLSPTASVYSISEVVFGFEKYNFAAEHSVYRFDPIT